MLCKGYPSPPSPPAATATTTTSADAAAAAAALTNAIAATVSAAISSTTKDRALHQWLLATLSDTGRGRGGRTSVGPIASSTAADADLQRLGRQLQLALLHVRAKPAEHARGRQHVRLRRRGHQRFSPLSRGNRAQRHARLGHGHHDRPHRLERLGNCGRAIRLHWQRRSLLQCALEHDAHTKRHGR